MRPGLRLAFWVLLAAVGGVLVWLVAAPNARLLFRSVFEDTPQGLAFSLEGWRAFFAPPGESLLGTPIPNAEIEALRNSVIISVGSVLLAGLVGVPMALLFHNYEFPGRRLFAALATLPVLLPPLVGVVAFYFLYAESGVITRLAGRLGLSWRFEGIGAVLVVHTYSMYVFFYTFVTAGLARLDESQVEAAATLGAGRWRRFWTVTFPLLTPSLVGAGLLVFMMSMASFTAPYVFGGVRVLTTQLLVSRQREQFLLMRVETVVLAAVCLLFLVLLRWVEGRGRYVGGSKGSGAQRRVVRQGWLRWLLGGVGIVTTLLLLLPHAMLVLISFADVGSWTTQLLPPAYTLDHYRDLVGSGWGPVRNSLAMAVPATLANVAFALLAAYLIGRFRFRGRGLIEALTLLPYAIPGTVIALGLAEWFSVDAPWAGRWVWINTFWILPVAYFIRNIPLTVRAVQASLAQVDPSVEEAAASLGAAPPRVLGSVVLPLVWPGALAGGMLAFIGAMGEFVASVVLYIPANAPISMAIWSEMRAYLGQAAAYGVVLIVLIAIGLGVIQLLARRDPGELAA